MEIRITYTGYQPEVDNDLIEILADNGYDLVATGFDALTEDRELIFEVEED